MINQIKEVLKNIAVKAQDNKDLLIKAGCALGGAAIGAVVTAVVINAQQDNLLEEIRMGIEEDDNIPEQ